MITNIANAYIGDSSISRIYQGEELVYENSHPDILLSYISNGNDAARPNVYFSTGVNPDITIEVEIKYSVHELSDGAVLFGSGIDSSTYTKYYVMPYAGVAIDGSTYYTTKWWYRNAAVGHKTIPTVDTPHVLSIWGTYGSSSPVTANTGSIGFDGSINSTTISITDLTSKSYMYLFARHNSLDNTTYSADALCYADTRVYYMKVWQDDKLIRFYIPVLHWNSTTIKYEPVFLDKISNTYMINRGTDNPSYEIKGDYVLNYIKRNSGALSFDTGVDVKRGLGIDVKFRAGSSISGGNTNEGIIVGVRDSSANKYGIYAPASGIAGSTTANWHLGLRGLGYNLTTTTNDAFNTDYRVSTSPTMSSKKLYLGTTKYTSSTAESSTAGAIGDRIKIFGDSLQRSWTNTLINYCIITDTVGAGRPPVCTMLPVLHNGVPCFYDMTNNSYSYNSDTGTPSWVFQK